MPISYRLDPPDRLVRCTATGVISFADLKAHQKKLNADPGFTFKETARMLWDFSGATGFDHSAAKWIETAESGLVPTRVRRALVAKPTGEVKKFLSLWVLHRTARKDPNIRLFDTPEKARLWLDEAAPAGG